MRRNVFAEEESLQHPESSFCVYTVCVDCFYETLETYSLVCELEQNGKNRLIGQQGLIPSERLIDPLSQPALARDTIATKTGSKSADAARKCVCLCVLKTRGEESSSSSSSWLL